MTIRYLKPGETVPVCDLPADARAQALAAHAGQPVVSFDNARKTSEVFLVVQPGADGHCSFAGYLSRHPLPQTWGET